MDITYILVVPIIFADFLAQIVCKKIIYSSKGTLLTDFWYGDCTIDEFKEKIQKISRKKDTTEKLASASEFLANFYTCIVCASIISDISAHNKLVVLIASFIFSYLLFAHRNARRDLIADRTERRKKYEYDKIEFLRKDLFDNCKIKSK